MILFPWNPIITTQRYFAIPAGTMNLYVPCKDYHALSLNALILCYFSRARNGGTVQPSATTNYARKEQINEIIIKQIKIERGTNNYAITINEKCKMIGGTPKRAVQDVMRSKLQWS